MPTTASSAPRVLIVVTSTDRRGAEVEGSQLADELSTLGLPTRCVALAPGATGGLDVPPLGPSPRSLRTVRALAREAAEHDVVVAYGSATLPACAFALARVRTPFVYRSIGDPQRWVRGRVHRARTGWLMRRAAHVVALWPGGQASIRSLYGLPAQRVSCIPNARSLPSADEMPSDAARMLWGLPPDAPVAAWAGALSEEKRPLDAVRAAAALRETHPDAWLVMAGDGPLRAEVEAAAQRALPGHHLLVGNLPSLAPLWAAADVALLTSRTEGMPGVLIEARLRGLPAVATDVGAVRDVVSDAGEVVPADASAGDVAAALHRWLGHRVDPEGAAPFTWPRVAQQWADLLRKVAR